jgi:hypothetical protein
MGITTCTTVPHQPENVSSNGATFPASDPVVWARTARETALTQDDEAAFADYVTA